MPIGPPAGKPSKPSALLFEVAGNRFGEIRVGQPPKNTEQ